jgi:glycosyltransferase involved in cell wall biosynthesis
MPLPKVLILCQPFNNNFGGGITLANLFTGWDKNKIAVVCTSHIFNNLNTDICDTYYVLGNEEHKWKFPFNYIQRRVLSGEVKVRANEENENSVTTKPTLRSRIVNNYFYPFLEYVGIFHGISKITMSPKLCKWIDEYKPDVVYAQAGVRETLVFCSVVQSYIKKPMVFHMMDDWPSTISQKGPFKKLWHKKIDGELRTVLDQSSILLSISDAMAKEYKARYNKNFVTFHNPIEIEFWKSHQRKNYQLSQSPSILYAGRIGTGVQVVLESMAEAIDIVNKQMDKSVRFILQTSEKPSWVENYKCVQHKSLVPYSDLPIVFGEADMLFLPYDFSAESIRYIKYSMPTKAPEYMVSGTPIIIFAPEETALVQDAVKGNWAKVVTENNIDVLCTAVKTLITDDVFRKQIAENAVSIAEAKYNAVIIRNRFKEVITSLATD